MTCIKVEGLVPCGLYATLRIQNSSTDLLKNVYIHIWVKLVVYLVLYLVKVVRFSEEVRGSGGHYGGFASMRRLETVVPNQTRQNFEVHLTQWVIHEENRPNQVSCNTTF